MDRADRGVGEEEGETVSLQELYDRAVADPDFAERLKADFVGTAREAGIEITPEEIKAALGMQDVSDEVAVDELQARVSKSVAYFATNVAIPGSTEIAFGAPTAPQFNTSPEILGP